MSRSAIRSVESLVVETPLKPLVFVAVETDDGALGTGEAAPSYAASGVADAVERMGEAVAGMDPAEPARVRRECVHPTVGLANNVVEGAAASAVDIACWDLKGKRAGAPVAELLGGAVNGPRLRAYASGWWHGLHADDDGSSDVSDDGPDEAGEDSDPFASAAADVVAEGYTALKCNPFGDGPADPGTAEIDAAIERIRAVRDAVGPDVDVYVEGHKRFTAAAALRIARRLDPVGVSFFEEPTPPTVGELRRVAAESPVPVATGESHVSRRAFADLFAETAVAVCQPDPVRTGGVTETWRIAAAAATHGVTFSPHNACGPVSTAASAHLGAAAPSFGVLETFEDYRHPDWLADLFAGGTAPEHGEVPVPDAPGLGIELDRDAARERARGD